MYYTPGSPDNRNEAANRGRYMDSLRAYGLWDDALFRYSTVDRRVLRPERLFPRVGAAAAPASHPPAHEVIDLTESPP